MNNKEPLENWFGIKIYKNIRIENIRIMFGEQAVIILFCEKLTNQDIIDYFAILNHFLKKNNYIEIVFGLLVNNAMQVIRRKIKNKIIKNFCENDLISLFSGSNPEAFYSPAQDEDHILGIEIRYKESIQAWHEESEELVTLNREIGQTRKKKLFLKNEQ